MAALTAKSSKPHALKDPDNSRINVCTPASASALALSVSETEGATVGVNDADVVTGGLDIVFTSILGVIGSYLMSTDCGASRVSSTLSPR